LKLSIAPHDFPIRVQKHHSRVELIQNLLEIYACRHRFTSEHSDHDCNPHSTTTARANFSKPTFASTVEKCRAISNGEKRPERTLTSSCIHPQDRVALERFMAGFEREGKTLLCTNYTSRQRSPQSRNCSVDISPRDGAPTAICGEFLAHETAKRIEISKVRHTLSCPLQGVGN